MFGIIDTLIGIFGKIFNKNSNENRQINEQIIENITPNNALMNARAAIIWICAIVLAIYWIPLYSMATYVWIKTTLTQGFMAEYPLDTKNLFEMIGSLLGLGGLGLLHKLLK